MECISKNIFILSRGSRQNFLHKILFPTKAAAVTTKNIPIIMISNISNQVHEPHRPKCCTVPTMRLTTSIQYGIMVSIPTFSNVP
jgi:hypothetical protein